MAATTKIVLVFLFVFILCGQANDDNFDNSLQKLKSMPRTAVASEVEWKKQVIIMFKTIAEVLYSVGCGNLQSLIPGKR